MSEFMIDEQMVGDLPLWTDDKAMSILEEIATANSVPIDVITELVTLQRARQHQERAAGIYQRIEEILGRMD
jgi:hypothetical protein